MPRLHKIGNIAIRVYAGDTQKHRRPHFHAVSPDDNLVISLPDLEVIEGSMKGAGQVFEWAEKPENLARLIDAWNQGNPTIPIRTSPPP